MKKFTTAAVAATMALGLAVPTADAAEDKSSDGAFWITTVVTGNTCKITNSHGTIENVTRDKAKQELIAFDERKVNDNHAAFLRGDANSTLLDFSIGESFNAYKACADRRTTPPTP